MFIETLHHTEFQAPLSEIRNMTLLKELSFLLLERNYKHSAPPER